MFRVCPSCVAVLAFTAATIMAGESSTPRFGDDDCSLWALGNNNKFSYNHEIVMPAEGNEGVQLLKRMAISADADKSRLALLIILQRRITNKYLESLKKPRLFDNSLLRQIGTATVDAMLADILRGSLPSFGGKLNIDVNHLFDNNNEHQIKHRNKLLYLIMLSHVESAIINQIESQCKAAAKGRLLPNADEVAFDGNKGNEVRIVSPSDDREYFTDSSYVRVSYLGDTKLTNVLLITRSQPKPGKPITQGTASVMTLNRFLGALTGTDPEREAIAAEILIADDIYSITPVSSFVFLRELNKGDVIHVPSYRHDFYANLLSETIFLYSDQGIISPRVLLKAATGNRKSAPPRPASAPLWVGPKFERLGLDTKARIQLHPKRGAVRPYTFEGCVPIGDSFRSTGEKLEVEPDNQGSLKVLAREKSCYIAFGPPRKHGHALIMVPCSAIAQVVMTSDGQTRSYPVAKNFIEPPDNPLNPQEVASPKRDKDQPIKKLRAGSTIHLAPNPNSDYRYTFQCCMLTGSGYRLLGKTIQIEYDDRVPLTALASNADVYIAIGRDHKKNQTAQIIVPRSKISEANTREAAK